MSSPISRAGLRSRRPTGSSALMAGAARPSNPAAFLPAKTAALSWPSISPGSASPCRPTVRPLFARAMVPAKAAAPRRVRCTISPSRPPKPTPPNERWLPSAGRSVLELYRQSRTPAKLPQPVKAARSFRRPVSACTPTIRRRSRGRRTTMATVKLQRSIRNRSRLSHPHPLLRLRPRLPEPARGTIDKSVLALAEPKRRRDKSHLRFVASQPCLVCGRHPSDPHHLRFAQPRALGAKVSDEFTVPLCRGHHRQLHQAGNESAWWEKLKIDSRCAWLVSSGSKPIPTSNRTKTRVRQYRQRVNDD